MTVSEGTDAAALGDVGDAERRALGRAQPVEVAPPVGDAPFGGGDGAGDGLEQGRLAGAVGPHDGDELALGHLERHAGQRMQSTVCHAKPRATPRGAFPGARSDERGATMSSPSLSAHGAAAFMESGEMRPWGAERPRNAMRSFRRLPGAGDFGTFTGSLVRILEHWTLLSRNVACGAHPRAHRRLTHPAK
jgi:hypothetical protein